jgi:hypothetical protein
LIAAARRRYTRAVAAPPQKPVRPGAPQLAQPPQDLSGKKTDELTDEAAKLEEEVEELRVKYEMYFLGTERKEPVRWREDVKKKVLRLKAAFTRNTGLRFRIQSLHARFLSYERLWLRSAREREEGTYRRDLFKAKLHHRDEPAASAPEPTPTAVGGHGKSDLASALAAAATHAAPPDGKTAAAAGKAPASKAPPARAAAGAGGAPIAERAMRELYDAYVAAKRRCNEDVSRLTYEAVAKSVSRQIPELMARYQAKTVDFKVVIKDGRAILKAIPKS